MQEFTDEKGDQSPPYSEMEMLLRKKKKGKKKRKQDDVSQPTFDIPGVTKIIISPSAQKVIECSVGEDVTSESPWKYVPKEALEGNLELQEESSDFLPIKDELLNYPKQEVLLGYIPDQMMEHDEFYICLTEPAEEAVSGIIDKLKREQNIKVQNAIVKNAKPWKTQGSESEVDLQIYKNNRLLLAVEFETKYPIMTPKCEFRLNLCETRKGGYLTFDTSRRVPNDIERKKVDACTQVTPYVNSHEAQTTYTFPKNAWTQYECAIELTDTISEEVEDNIQHLLSKNIDNVSDVVGVNNCINFYENEYENLIRNKKYTRLPKTVDFEEYLSFMDVSLCKSKKITSVTWHPMWTGTLAIAYSPDAPNEYLKTKVKTDDVEKAICNLTSVLVWSFKDNLTAKLLLETPREVSVLSFCPYNENLLVGGCVNGQIIVWDVKDKLENVEREENASLTQLKYRNILYSALRWKKSAPDLSTVRPTVVSDIEYSHADNVSDIRWLSPFNDIAKSGHVLGVPEEEQRTTLMFITCSHDGTVLIWDLLIKLEPYIDSYRSPGTSRRLSRRPSALVYDQSPFRCLHNILKPKFKIEVQFPQVRSGVKLSALSVKAPSIEYVERSRMFKKLNINDKILHEPLLINPKYVPESQFAVATMDGDFLIGSWEGIEIDPYEAEEVLYKENCKIQSSGRFHDGPVICLSACTIFSDLILSVGGKVFALWNNNLKNKPLMWRRCRQKYTHGVWDKDKPYVFRLTRCDGNMEIWNLKIRSNTFVELKSIAGVGLGGTFRHPLNMERNILGVSDSRGWFRTFFIPKLLDHDMKESKFNVYKMCEREVNRKSWFAKWQESWTNKIKTKKLTDVKSKKRISTKTETASKYEFPRISLKRQPGKHAEWAQEQWMQKQGEFMKVTLLEKKGLNRELLELQQLPLTKLNQEKALKKAKEQQRLRNADKIFNNTVAMLFPEAVEEKRPPISNPYADCDSVEIKEKYYSDYLRAENFCENFIRENPYEPSFSYIKIIRSGVKTRKILDGYYDRYSHKERIQREKKKKQEEEKARLLAATLAQEAAKKTRVFRHVQRKPRTEQSKIALISEDGQKAEVSEEKKTSE